jgi:hypothetical protein
MGIAEEIDIAMGTTAGARFRKLLVEVDGARAFFEKWRKQSDYWEQRYKESVKEVNALDQALIGSRQSEADARNAANVLADQFAEISDYIRDNFPDQFGEKTQIAVDTASVTLSHEDPGARDVIGSHRAGAVMGPQTVFEKTIFLLGELLKIRQKFGGSGADKINRLIGGKD